MIKRNIRKNLNFYWVFKLCIGLGATLLIVSGFLLVFWKTVNYLIIVLILTGIALFGQNFLSYIGMDKLKEERLRRIGTVSAMYSWVLTLIFACFMVFYDFFTNTNLTGPEILGLIIIVMVSTMPVINTILNHRGSVE